MFSFDIFQEFPWIPADQESTAMSDFTITPLKSMTSPILKVVTVLALYSTIHMYNCDCVCICKALANGHVTPLLKILQKLILGLERLC
jgi:hypothetical protein